MPMPWLMVLLYMLIVLFLFNVSFYFFQIGYGPLSNKNFSYSFFLFKW